jgi:anti-sigma factor RsiW
MKCPVVKNMFSEYIDDELPQDRKEAVNLHLRECEACRNKLDEFLAVHGLFASAEHFSAPYGFSTRVIANLEDGKESVWRKMFFRPVFLRAIEVTFALIILIVGLISGNLLTARKPPALTSAEVRQSFALDLFEATPTGSIGGVYASMTEVGNER